VPDDKYLDIRDLDAGYGRSQVLFGVTLNVPWRGGVAILGRNGAGKTTLMKAIVGELPLLGGSIMLDSRDVGQLPTEKRIRSWICPARAFGIRTALGAGQSCCRRHDKPR
jgi:branched-chain amino acid transport system ATP-binding protein